MELGNIVEYIDRERIMCAVILEVRSQRLRLMTQNNKEVNLSASRLVRRDRTRLDLTVSRTRMVDALKEVARRRKEPTISFDRINAIQKGMMMAGREGKSWYVTGWHLGREGTMRKLIAYSPGLAVESCPVCSIHAVTCRSPFLIHDSQGVLTTLSHVPLFPCVDWSVRMGSRG